MIPNPDQELLAAFREEAEAYLPDLRRALAVGWTDSFDPSALAEVHRLAHTIKGAAAMVGLEALSRTAGCLEDALEALVQGWATGNDEIRRLFSRTVDHLEKQIGTLPDLYLDPEGEGDRLAQKYLQHFDSLPKPEEPAYPDTPMPEWPAPGFAVTSQFDSPDFPTTISEPNWQEPTSFSEEPGVADELAEVFAAEAEEHFRAICEMLPVLRDTPEDQRAIQGIRRSAHTLKGAAAMVGFREITELSHRMEDLLDQISEGSRRSGAEVVDLLSATSAVLEELAGQRADPVVVAQLYEEYDRLLSAQEVEPSVANLSEPGSGVTDPASRMGGFGITDSGYQEAESGLTVPAPNKANAEIEALAPRDPSIPEPATFVRVPVDRLDAVVNLVGELLVNRHRLERHILTLRHHLGELQRSDARLTEVSEQIQAECDARGGTGSPTRGTTGPKGTDHSPTTPEGFDDLEFDRYTDFYLLTRRLSETAGDIHTLHDETLVLQGELEGYLTRHARLIADLDESLKRLRTVPLASLLPRLQRTVWQVSRDTGKDVDLMIEGGETGLDTGILQGLVDPLLHLLRNAVDHGIEAPEERLALGKPSRGTITLRATTHGTQVVLVLSDNGRGVDLDAVRAKAIARELVSASLAHELTPDELYDFLFTAGFTTAKVVTEVSGRGVGLDIVRDQVTRLKGSVIVESVPGEGTTFTVRLPMSLALMNTLLFHANGQTYALPLEAVSRVLRPEAGQVTGPEGKRVLHLEGEEIPWVTLPDRLPVSGQESAIPYDARPIILLRHGGRQLALGVDELIRRREMVVKNLGRHVRRLPGVLGATLTGEGGVVLILDPAVLVTPRRGVVPASVATDETWSAVPSVKSAYHVLVVDDSPSVRRVVTATLQRQGWEVSPARDGLEALELLRRLDTPPDVCLSDVEMPRMDGYELLAALKADSDLHRLPVVFLTSRAAQKHRDKAEELGAAGYVTKPFQDEDLIRELTQAVELVGTPLLT